MGQPSPRRPARGVDVAVASLAAVVVLSLVCGVALHLSQANAPLAAGVTDWWTMPVVGGIAFGGAGLWLARARPWLGIGWLLAGIGVLLSTSGAALEYGVAALPARPEDTLATWVFWRRNRQWGLRLFTGAVVAALAGSGFIYAVLGQVTAHGDRLPFGGLGGIVRPCSRLTAKACVPWYGARSAPILMGEVAPALTSNEPTASGTGAPVNCQST